MEEWFYLLIPLAFFLFKALFPDNLPKRLLVFSILLLTGLTLLRLLRYQYSRELPENLARDWDLIYRKQVFMRLDSLLYGVIAAWVCLYCPAFWNKRPRVLFSAGAVLFLGSHLINKLDLQGQGLYHCVFSSGLAGTELFPFLDTYPGLIPGALQGV